MTWRIIAGPLSPWWWCWGFAFGWKFLPVVRVSGAAVNLFFLNR